MTQLPVPQPTNQTTATRPSQNAQLPPLLIAISEASSTTNLRLNINRQQTNQPTNVNQSNNVNLPISRLNQQIGVHNFPLANDYARLDEEIKLFLTLRNRGSDCFLIAAVNFLQPFALSNNWLLNTHPDLDPGGTLRNLQVVYNRGCTDVGNLRNTLELFRDNEHHDSTSAIQALVQRIEFLPFVAQNKFLLEEVQRCNSNNCGYAVEKAPESSFIASRNLSEFKLFDAEREQITFDQLIHEQTGLFVCGKCGSTETEWRTTVTITNQNFFAMLVNNQTGVPVPESKEFQQMVVDLKVTDLNVDCTQIYGFDFRLVSAVEYRSWMGDGKAGHYVTWRRNHRKTWSILDDATLYQSNDFPKDVSIFTAFLFERLN